MAVDIGTTIFAEILGMTQYPGSPFTGEIVRDLILFLFVPSVFIIMFIVVLLGRIVASEYGKMRLLVGMALYMFIVASGYYAAFALIAGPYFVFLIFILGALYFLPAHFGLRKGGGTSKMRAGFDFGERTEIQEEIDRLRTVIREAEKIRDEAISKNLDRTVQSQNEVIRKAEAEIHRLEKRLRILPRVARR
jgi:hypothetical protein